MRLIFKQGITNKHKAQPMTAKILSLITLTLCSACSIQMPELNNSDVPQTWQGPLQTDANIWPDKQWWKQFNNSEISQLLTQVQDNNLDIANNRHNLQAAQITLRSAGFDLWPTPTLNIGSDKNWNNTSGDNIGTQSHQSHGLRAGISYTHILSKPVNYDRAVAQYQSSLASATDLALNTLGTSASTYFQILLTRDKIKAAQQNLENAQAIARIAQAKVDAGTSTAIDALQQRIAVEQQRNNLRNFRQNELSARASLALLLGRSVQDFTVEGQSLDDIIVPKVQPGIPSQLLQRRPDLVQVEANLRSSKADVEIARLAFLPTISLTASGNSSSTSLSDLLHASTTTVSITADIVQTLLDNGQRFRDEESARLRLQIALNTYRKTVIGAFNEVEVSLGNISLLDDLASVAADDKERAEKAYHIAQARYREGVTDYQTVLTAQNTLYSVRNSYFDNKLRQLNAIVNFYITLGGGWHIEEGEQLLVQKKKTDNKQAPKPHKVLP
ncbi:MAG: TolC family protein [Spongiibacteraceae bacterium]|nr:TolC family protein [Spongiibacteraceae bacterium]